MSDQRLDAITADGLHLILDQWSSDNSAYDAQGWLDTFGQRIGNGTAKLPSGGWVDLSACVIVFDGSKGDE
jgi:hypothetical protein